VKYVGTDEVVPNSPAAEGFMTRYSLMRAVGRVSRPEWILAALMATLVACAPLAPAANQAADQTSRQDSKQTAALSTARPADGPLPVPPNLIALTQPAGQQRLMATAHKQS